MRFAFVSIFPGLIQSAAGFGVIGRALQENLADLRCFNPRDHAVNKHGSVDDRPYGGGPGMVMRPEPLVDSVGDAQNFAGPKAPVVALTPQGKRFNRQTAVELVKCEGLVLLAGRYEGIDERVIEACVDQELSIGDFVVSGGELPALLVMDAVLRMRPGVLGHESSAAQDSFEQDLLDCPHYTRPECFAGRRVPDVLLSGDHGAIAQWRREQAVRRTLARRPDLLDKARGGGQWTVDDEARLERLLSETKKTDH